MPPRPAAFRSRFGKPEVKIGTFVFEFATPGIGHICAAAGCEYVVIDMEHSGFGFDTVRAAIRYVQAAGLPAYVRVPSKQREDLSRTMDAGADGVMVPFVSSAEQARHVVDCVKYAPLGKRGVAMGFAHDRFVPPTLPLGRHLASHNARTVIMLQVEDGAGAEAADAMAAIEGVDCLWVGHFDLSVSLGIPARFDDARFRRAVELTLKACRRHGKSAGRLAGTVAECAALYRQGFDIIALANDVALLQGALATGMSGLRERCRTGAARTTTKRRR